jgi:NDP-sugar pyrophosphorylase family protein
LATKIAQIMKKIDTLVAAVGGRGDRLSDYFKVVNFNNTKTVWPINGQPLLKYLIDAALSVGLKRVFLLASFYEKEVREFVDKFYKNQNVIVVFGGDEGKKEGVNRALSFIRDQLKEPFIYSDGDILFDGKLLEDLLNISKTKNFFIKCVVSPKDQALTHSRFIINNDYISQIDLRYANSPKESAEGRDCYYSLGLMVINNNVFNFMPQYKDMNDLDVLVKELFYKNHGSVDYKIYEGDWFSIHNKADIDKINNGHYNKLLRSLTKFILEGGETK